MAFGFHLVVIGNSPAEDILRRVNETARVLGFSARSRKHEGGLEWYYRQSEDRPDLPVAFEFGSGRQQLAMYPLEETEAASYGSEVLVKFWSSISISLNGALGRTFHESGYGTIQPSEIEGPLQFVDWYQYFSLDIVKRWGLEYLRNGPFYRVDEYSNGACGIWLAKSRSHRLGRTKAAEYLGVTLPKLYWRHVRTGEPVEMPWD